MKDSLPILGSPQGMEVSGRDRLEAKMSDGEYAAYADRRIAEIQARNGVANRGCGECTACCTVMSVAALKKGNYQPCPHNCGQCAIYDSRPNVCRGFCCSWLLGRIAGDEQRRPDKLGLIFFGGRLTGKPITSVCEVWPCAAREPAAAQLLAEMSQKVPIVLRQYQTSTYDVITPDPELRQHILQLLDHELHPNWYTQAVVANF